MALPRTLLASTLVALAFSPVASAQSPASRTGRGTARAAFTTGYEVAINAPLSNLDPNANPSQKPLIIVARCNATSVIKNVEAWVGMNQPATVQDMVTSQSGNHRTSVTFVVPWGWYYRVKVSFNTVGANGSISPDETIGQAANMDCHATAWWTD